MRAHAAASAMRRVDPDNPRRASEVAREFDQSTAELRRSVRAARSARSEEAKTLKCFGKCLDLDEKCREGSTPGPLCNDLFTTCINVCD